VAAFTIAARLLGDGKLPGVPPDEEAELSPPPLWSSLPHPHGQYVIKEPAGLNADCGHATGGGGER
jgi:hypothetical protein